MTQLGMLPHLEGHEIGGCRLIRRLGAGGMGEVYLAEQMRLGGRLVAIKIIRPGDDAPGEFQDAARRFLQEGKLLGRFSHPNILPVHESGIDSEYLYLVMEYAPDGSLNDAIRGRGPHPLALPLAAPLAAEIIDQIAAALQYTHGRGIVHGDVKPGNVLVVTMADDRHRLLLADFGVARELEATAQWSMVAGTVAYMAPEQFSGRFSPASDQYALGIVAYQLLAGRTPFAGGFAEQMRGHLNGRPPRLRGLNPTVPPQVEAAIHRALAKDPRHRFPTVLAFADALEGAVCQEGEATVPSTASTWDATLRVRLGTGTSLLTKAQPGIHTYRPPSAVRGFQVGRRPSTSGGLGTPPYLGQRRLALLSVCAALLLLTAVLARGGAPPDTSSALTPHKAAAVAITPVHTPTMPTTPTIVATTVPALPPLHVEQAISGNSFAAIVSAPEAIAPGRSFTADVTLRNTGNTIWSQSRGYRLTCDTVRIYQPPSHCTHGLAVSLGQHVIPPGNAITFQLLLRAPKTPGVFSAWVTMAQGRTLFSTAAAHIQVAVRYLALEPTPTTTPGQLPTATLQPAPTSTATPPPSETPTPSPATPTPTYTEDSRPGGQGPDDGGSGDEGSGPGVEQNMS